ncbi:GNAT family N-acetyltransferase [Pectobacterium odoriferum]|uniref:GNAT family N-acetyltransferase n=1 Tax=Pectobacterium odoriferum TaxID=78398 RepID=UPI0011AED98B|nr:GNAT family N-acetyltransferase [Pectobacterium odoriferum]
MKYLTREEARILFVNNPSVNNLFEAGYHSTMDIANQKLMNDKKVRPNAYLVNDNFETEPMCFSAFYSDRIYKVIRCIYVSPEHRNIGLAKQMITTFQEQLPYDKEFFLQIGVEATGDDRFKMLDALYSGLGFKNNPIAIPHPGNKSYFDYFWSYNDFEVIQNPFNISQIAARII